jgi:hypothetical protein
VGAENMKRLRVNFVGGIIENDPLPASGVGSDYLVSAALVALPELAVNEYVALVLDPDGLNGEPEIVWVVDHGYLNPYAEIMRGQEGTPAREHNPDTFWIHAPTADDWNKTSFIINTDGNPGHTIYVGSIDPSSSYDMEIGDIWIEMGVEE